ncbi:MAG: dihydropteroate synthase [Luteolibacter sp.]
MFWKIGSRTLDLSEKAHIMGILNVTPDSFSDGGKFDQLTPALQHAREMIAQGATIIDIGGESTRPGSAPVSPTEELERTIPVIQALRAEWNGHISIDTQKANVAAAALAAGADIVNDVSGLTADPKMPATCAASDCGIVIMHMQGTPADMQQNPSYEDILTDIRAFFTERLATLTALGIHPARLCFDPGIGFGKTLGHNLTLIRHLETLAPTDSPLLLGVSRKSLLSKISSDRDAATIAVTTYARQKGIMLHRVHTVAENLAALRTVENLVLES